MLELADWLRQHIPLEDSSGATAGLVHGDFRIDNVVFHPIEVPSVPCSLCYWSSFKYMSHIPLSPLQKRLEVADSVS